MTNTRVPWIQTFLLTGLSLVVTLYLVWMHSFSGSSRSSHLRGLPAQLAAAPFHTSVGCWHVVNSRASADMSANKFTVVAEVNFVPGEERWREVLKAVSLSQKSNPNVHYVFVTSDLALPAMLVEARPAMSFDVWHCLDVLFGTTISIGNLYGGVKLAASADDWFPPFNLSCRFSNGSRPVVFLLQRENREGLSNPSSRTCRDSMRRGSADGIMFEHIGEDVLPHLRFPRSFWGSDSLSNFVLQRAGYLLVNLCPVYVPVHVHNSSERTDGRLRINHPRNDVPRGSDDLHEHCSLSK
jgi:hypothetical protein